MKNIFKTSKRGIAAILTLCILLGIAGTCVYAASVMPEETTAVTEETTQELVPVMARGCSVDAGTLHELFDNLGYTYEGVGKNTVLNGGYSYTTGYSHNYINVYIYNGNEFIGSYRISTIG